MLNDKALKLRLSRFAMCKAIDAELPNIVVAQAALPIGRSPGSHIVRISA
jgi:hypothetical protein